MVSLVVVAIIAIVALLLIQWILSLLPPSFQKEIGNFLRDMLKG